MIKALLITLALQLPWLASFAQTNDKHEKTENPEKHEKLKRNEIAAYMLMTFAPEYNEEGGRIGYAVLPGVGLDYNFWIGHRWGLSLATSFSQFDILVNTNENEIIERDNVFSLSLMGFYEPVESWRIFAGYGREIDSENNFGVVSLTTDYAFEIGHNWAALLLLESHFRTHFFSAALGVGFSKRF